MSNTQAASLLKTMKALLHEHRLSQANVAERLGVTTRTVRRWFTSDTVDTGVLEQMCALIGIELFDLFQLAAKDSETKADHLTREQELVLVSNPILWYLFHQILLGWDAAELQQDTGLPTPILVKSLISLEKAGLIDLLPNNKIRLRTVRYLKINPGGPYAHHVNAFIQSFWDRIKIGDPHSVLEVEALKLSAASKTQLSRRFEQLIAEARELSDADRRSNDKTREWYFMVLTAQHFSDDENFDFRKAAARQIAAFNRLAAQNNAPSNEC